MGLKIAILLPAYNESSCIAEAMSRFHQACPEGEIVVINNNSSDSTYAIATAHLRKLACSGQVLDEPRPGKGQAIRRAFQQIDADIYVMVDSDLTYSEQDLPQLIAPVLAGTTDMAVGDRLSLGAYSKVNPRRFHGFGNQLVAWLINRLFGATLKDVMSGYRVFSRQFVDHCPIMMAGFELETELTLNALHYRFRIKEIPISFHARAEGTTSKLRTISDGTRVLLTIFNLAKDFRPLLFFSLMSAFFGLAALLIGIPVLSEYMRTHYIHRVPSAILSTGLAIITCLLFSVGLILDTVSKNQKSHHDLWIRQNKKQVSS